MWFEHSSEQCKDSSTTLLKRDEDVNILDVFNRKDGLNVNAPDFLQMVCGSSINFEINNTCSSVSTPSSNWLSNVNATMELDSSKADNTACIVKPPQRTSHSFSGNSVNDYQDYSFTAISPARKDKLFNAEYYDDYSIETSANPLFEKRWQGVPVVYPESAAQHSGASPILMVPPQGDFRMPVSMPMSGYPYPAFGMLPEDMTAYHRPMSNVPMGRVGHGASSPQYIPAMNAGHSPNGLILSPMRSPSNANKVTRSSIPIDGYIYQVQFKRAHRNFILAPSAPRNIMPGDFVKVEADRGEDMGIVLNKSLVCDFEEVMPTAGYRGRGFSSGQGEKKYLYRLATMEERAALAAKVEDEERTLEVIREKVLERALPMAILDAEYQFDRHKLTFFFEAERRIDFRELVSELFSQYKTRIWMQQVDTSSLPYHDAGIELAQATGFLPMHSNSNYTFVQSPSRFGGEPSGASDGNGHSLEHTRQNYENQSLRTSTSSNVSSCNTAFSSPERTPSSQQRAASYPSGSTPFHSPSTNSAAIGSSNINYSSSKNDAANANTFSFPEFGKDKSLEGRYSPVCVSTPANEDVTHNTAVPLFESSSLWSYGL